MKRHSALWAATLLLLCWTPAGAQSIADYDYANLTFRGIGVDYGFIWPSKVEATSAYTLRLDLGYLGPGVRIVPTVSYWSSTFKPSQLARLADQLNRLPSLRDREVTIDPSELGTIELSDISLGIDAHLVWTTPVRVFTYIGGGFSLHALNGRGSAVENTFVEDLLDSTTAGVAGMVGAELQVMPRVRLYSEVRYTLLSDVRYPGFRVGGALMLPQRTTPAVQRTQNGQ
jgi:hypothetical protein